MKRPTGKTGTMVLAAALLVVAGTTAQAGWLFVLAAGVLGVMAGSALVPHRMGHVEITRTHPGRARVGDEVPVVLGASSNVRVGPLRVFDDHPAFERCAIFVEAVSARRPMRVETSRRASRRGITTGGPVEMVTGAPFGMTRSRRSVEVASPIVVTPRWVELDTFPLLEPASFPTETLHERARTGGGQDYLAVREFRSGDPLRHVHWRSSARAGRLIVREFSEQIRTRILIVLTGADHGAPPDSAFETAVSAAASVALYAVATGHPVDLARPGPGGDIDRIGDVDRSAVLTWLAGADPVDADPSDVLAPSLGRAGRRATVVFVTTIAGAAARGLGAAVGEAQAAGARAIVVAVRSTGWGGADDVAALDALGSRPTLRVIDRGDDLKRSLEG